MGEGRGLGAGTGGGEGKEKVEGEGEGEGRGRGHRSQRRPSFPCKVPDSLAVFTSPAEILDAFLNPERRSGMRE